MEVTKNDFLKYRRKGLFIFYITFFILLSIGVLALNLGQGSFQRFSTENKQAQHNDIILNEVKTLSSANELIAVSTVNDFDVYSQKSLNTIISTLNADDFIINLYKDKTLNPEGQTALNNELKKIINETGFSDIFFFEDNGKIISSSNSGKYYDKSMLDYFNEDQFNQLKRYFYGENEIYDGTYSYINGEEFFYPVALSDSFVYSFTSLFDETISSSHVFTCCFIPNTDIISCIEKLTNTSNVLKSINPGNNGILASIDVTTGIFLYFVDGDTILNYFDYQKYGLDSNSIYDGYVGYQTINGKTYFVSIKTNENSVYSLGQYILCCIPESSLFKDNKSLLIFTVISLVGIFTILAFYETIIKNSNLFFIASAKKRHEKKLLDSKEKNYSDDEAKTLANNHIQDLIISNEEIHIRGLKFGKKEFYFSTRAILKGLPFVILCLFFFFFSTSFLYTLIEIKNVNTLSSSRLDDATTILNVNKDNNYSTFNNINKNFLDTNTLLSFSYQRMPNNILIFDPNDPNVYPLTILDEKGEKIPVKDCYGNPRYANATNSYLNDDCRGYNIFDISLYDEKGYVLSTSSSNWYYEIPSDPNDENYGFREVIDRKKNSFISNVSLDSKENELFEYIGVPFYYYTINQNNETKYISDKEAQKESEALKHRGVSIISLSRDIFSNLLKMTYIENILAIEKVYCSDSFFMAFEDNIDHQVIYSPTSSDIGQKAETLGIPSKIFNSTSTINDFIVLSGKRCSVSVKNVDNYFILAAVPENQMYKNRLFDCLIVFGICTLVLFITLFFFSLSNRKIDMVKARYFEKFIIFNQVGKIIEYPKMKLFGKNIVTPFKTKYNHHKFWFQKSADEKLAILIFIFFIIISTIILILYFISIHGGRADSLLSYLFLGKWDRGFNVYSISAVFMIMTVTITYGKLFVGIINLLISFFSDKAKTIGSLLASIIHVGFTIFSILFSLYLFGFDLNAILASAGIVSVILGIGAQSIVGDILSGLFIVFEHNFKVGDIVEIGDFRGWVIDIGLRTTKIENSSLNIKILNNSAISGVLNMSEVTSAAIVYISIEYNEDVHKVEQLFKNEFPNLAKKNPDILSIPVNIGISKLNESSVDFKIVAACEEKRRTSVERYLNREIYLLLLKNNINVPYKNITLSFKNNSENDINENISENKAFLNKPSFINVDTTENDVYKLIKLNPSKTTISDLCLATDLSRSTIIRILNNLEEKGLIFRVGSKKTGHWEAR